MRLKYLILFFVIFAVAGYSQNQLNTYALPPHSLIGTNVSLNAPMQGIPPEPANYNVGLNTDFTVRVKKSGTEEWSDLFEYNTFINKSLGDLTESARSTFVAFDFAGSVTVEITCNNYSDVAGKVLIRPLSKKISPTIQGNTITFTIDKPSQYSVEIDGHRYNNLQVFANGLSNYSIVPTITYEAGVHIYDTLLNAVHKKVHIKPGAVLIVPYKGTHPAENNAKIIARDNDEFFIEGGAVLKGGILGYGVNNVRIYGRGMIDLSNYTKQYDKDLPAYAYIHALSFTACKNVTIDGITISDPQQYCLEINESDGLTVTNVKFFSRAKWADGIHMQGTSNVTIADCYIRTSDDCVAIYCSRHGSPPYPPENQNTDYRFNQALNITVNNTLLYADRAHAIEIGWHGDNAYGHELNIRNVSFTDIDILEHDEVWIDKNGTYIDDYTGAISINCSDNIVCSNFMFRNINVEDFSNGRLFSVNVEPKGLGASRANGKQVSGITFSNLAYNGYGERRSTIRGLSRDRCVKDVHFENFTVNGKLITRLRDYKANGIKMIKKNRFTYNITFNEEKHWYSFIQRMF